ncbi:UDP-N-acetylmuramoyl-L-alanyl-D-glutamate--2,6-diaminopimelate ligase [Haloferula helveola]|uniref:UDP-N-acetylmuramoyl-L-alanyl-D-glutamate--2,6-diaminopimelate ligase n=1 Tax=Haloferula helveola TaxID=490095 RepID=A0ABN6H293_9BACT|nr:UDP-N-acetylmuramoyl-L-alanyl-D-glutamate--2,6-diaminopimelate ligase [Haloferula helveola]
MKLRELVAGLRKPLVVGDLDIEVTGVTSDSRSIEPGFVFVAIRGTQSDGRRFIGPAVEAGAVAVISETAAETGDPSTVTWIQVADARLALSSLAAGLAENPSQELKLVGVTGTNGKTTTGFLSHHLMKTEWHRAGLLGTVQVDDGEGVVEASHTTPDAVALQSILRRMADNGCRGAALEVSSHGIDQKRVADVAFDALVFTNLTQDHLDYHGTMEAYAAAKISWFEDAASNPREKKPVAVLNLDDPSGAELAETLEGQMSVVTYGFGLRADLRAIDFRQSARGMEFKLEAKGRKYLVRAPLIGRFNAYNILASLGAARAVGIPLRNAIAAMAEAPQVPGRMENCGIRDGVTVFVDYAHTPDAVENACRTLKELEPRRLITVFGCGGDRDRGKRPLMAKAAARYSDACIITSDNPRGEDPEAIIGEIEAGMDGARYKSVPDRAEAIRIAIHAAGNGDIVLIAGKGHETYQQFSDETIQFDDRREARKALAERPPREERGRR